MKDFSRGKKNKHDPKSSPAKKKSPNIIDFDNSGGDESGSGMEGDAQPNDLF